MRMLCDPSCPQQELPLTITELSVSYHFLSCVLAWYLSNYSTEPDSPSVWLPVACTSQSTRAQDYEIGFAGHLDRWGRMGENVPPMLYTFLISKHPSNDFGPRKSLLGFKVPNISLEELYKTWALQCLLTTFMWARPRRCLLRNHLEAPHLYNFSW